MALWQCLRVSQVYEERSGSIYFYRNRSISIVIYLLLRPEQPGALRPSTRLSLFQLAF